MSRERISQGSDFEQTIGYSRAVVDGRWVFVAGHDRVRLLDHDDLRRHRRAGRSDARQHRRRPRPGGFGPADVVRVRYLLPNGDDFEACWPSLRRYFGDARPAATMMVVGLQDPRMKIEIEVTALKPER